MNISNKGNLHSNIKNPAPSSAANEPVTVASIDAEFLPLIYDVVRSIEKEMTEGSKSMARESLDYHMKVQTLKDKLDKCRSQVNSVKGIDITKDEQVKRVEVLKNLMVQKRELLSNYKNRCPIEGVPRTE